MKALVNFFEMSDKNPFNRLPEELIIYIFEKISDAKSLCICTLVSRKFSTLVHQIQAKTISVEIPLWMRVCECHQDPTAAAATPPPLLVKLLVKLLVYAVILLVNLWLVLRKYIYPSKKPNKSSNYKSIRKFLKRFSSIESLTFHLGFYNNPSGSFEPLVRWKFEKSEFIFLSAKSVCVYSSEETFENAADDDVLVEPFTHLKNLICYHLLDAISRYEKILKPILCDFPNLKYISVTDSLNQGQIVLDEDYISSLRNEDEPILMEDDGGVNFSLKLWHENVVHLPISGRVMKDVGVVMCKKIGTDDCLMKSGNGFEGEEFRELATTMVKKAARSEGVVPLALLLRLSRGIEGDQE